MSTTTFIMFFLSLTTTFIMFQLFKKDFYLCMSYFYLTFAACFNYDLFNVFKSLCMSDVVNKEIIQSYVLTAAKYDFSVYEKRILYRIIELMQEHTEGKKLDRQYHIQENLFGDVDIQMPTSAFLKDEKDQNYSIVKKSLMDLNLKRVQFVDKKRGKWYLFNVIERPIVHMKQGLVSFRIHPIMATAFMDFSMGHRKYELKISMQFESVYAMRFYELMSGQKNPIIFGIDKLKEMFKLENKYKQVNDFIKRVIEPAKRELDEYSPFSFEYKINKEGRKYSSITFIPKFQPQHQDEDLERQRLQQKISPRYTLTKQEINYLRENFGFTTPEIKKNIDTFRDVLEVTDLMNELDRIKSKINEYERVGKKASNIKGYVIISLRNAVNRIIERAQGASGKPVEEAAPSNPMDVLTGIAENKNINKK